MSHMIMPHKPGIYPVTLSSGDNDCCLWDGERFRYWTDGWDPVSDINCTVVQWRMPNGEQYDDSVSAATADVLRERQRQVAAGHDSMHDDSHNSGELVWNALECANYAIGYEVPLPTEWGLGEKHKGDRRRLLVIAAALLIAEIERSDRAEPSRDEVVR